MTQATLVTLGLKTGNNPRTLSLYDTSGTLVDLGTVDSSAHSFTLAPATLAVYAPLASPTFTGVPAGPTAAVDTNTTQLATTAFYVGQASSSSPLMNNTVAVGTSLRFARGDHVHPVDTSRAGLNTAAASGDVTTYFNPSHFGTPGDIGVIWKTNRIMVGLESSQGTQTPQSPTSWVHAYTPDLMSYSSVAATNQLGLNALSGATRTSDYRTWLGAASGGAQSITGFALNDDTGAGTPIAAGVVGIAWRNNLVNGITLNQMDVNNQGAVVDAKPTTGVNSGSTWALGLTAGAYNNALASATGALYIGIGMNAKFRRGIVCFSDSLDTAVGAGGNGMFAAVYYGQSYAWYNSGGTVAAELYATNAGTLTNTGHFVSQGDLGISGITTLTGALTVNNVAFFAATTATPASGSAAASIRLGTTSGLGIFYGSGIPTVAAAQGSWYMRSDGSSTTTRMYINRDGGTTWTAVTTVA